MIYFPLSAALAALARCPPPGSPGATPPSRPPSPLALVAPNLAWNAANQFATLHHTADNADWQRLRLDLAGLAGFLAGQFAVAGPVFFAAYLAGLARLRDPQRRYLALMSLPVLAIVSVQALVSGANANWAAAAHLAALVLAAAVLAPRPRLLAAGLAINLAVTAALPVAAIFADRWRIGRQPRPRPLRRPGARSAGTPPRSPGPSGLDTLVSGNRAMLADFFYTLRDSGLAIYAEPTEGFPPAPLRPEAPAAPRARRRPLRHPHPSGPACRAATPVTEVARWQPAEGFVTSEIYAFRVPRACWFPAEPPAWPCTSATRA